MRHPTIQIFYFIILITMVGGTAFGQAPNLLVNPGLENHDSCSIKHRVDFFNGAFGWERIKPSTPDLFCSGGIPTDNGTPKNYQGTQPPHSGEAYLGLVTEFLSEDKSPCREYAVGTLTSPLEEGRWYYLEFFYSLADKSPYAMDRLGMKLFTPPLDDDQLSTCPQIGKAYYLAEPDLETKTASLNTEDWQHISGTYLAQGGESHLVLGCFRPSDPILINYRLLNPNQSNSKYSSYYYFDDIRVVKIGLQLPDTVYLCPGTPLDLQAQIDTLLRASIHWNTGQSGDQIRLTAPGTYIITIAFGQTEVKDTTVAILLPDHLDLGRDTFICEDASYILSPTPAFDSYLWNDGSSSPYLPITRSGHYTLRAQNKCGVFKDDINVDVIDCTCQVFVPNVFTPNGDQQNDRFGPYIYCQNPDIVRYRFVVYNRWGGIVYEANSPTAQWAPGPSVPPGVYAYELTVQLLRPDGNTGTFVQNGTVTLMR